MPTQDTLTLAEVMFHAEQFCCRVEAAFARHSWLSGEDAEELRLKLGQARNILAELQRSFDGGRCGSGGERC